MRGYIYILATSERPGVVKIGKTTVLPGKRCNQINEQWYLSLNTWEVQFWRWVENCSKAESEIHRLFSNLNLGAKKHREAFRVDIITAKETVERVCDKYPAKSDKPVSRAYRQKKKLDRLAYDHIQKSGPLAPRILENKSLLRDEEFYGWLYEIRDML